MQVGVMRLWAGSLLCLGLMACLREEPTVVVAVSPSAAEVQTGASLQLQATVTGTDDARVRWTIQEGATGGTVSAEGLYTAPAAAGTFHVVATSEADPEASATATLSVRDQTTGDVRVSVTPGEAALTVGGQQTFTATVTGTSNTAVTWTATGGEISQGGHYTAGGTPGTYQVTATSVEDPRRSASAVVRLSADGENVTVSITPESATLVPGQQQAFSATVTGAADTSVTWSATCGTVDATGRYTAPATPGSCTVTATSVADASRSDSASIQVVPPGEVQVAVAPSSVTLTPGQQQVFAATVTGTAEGAVTWSATCGTIDAHGRYTAPATAGTCTVKATSVADDSKSATASVQVVQNVQVELSPASLTLEFGKQQKFTATVTGAANTSVTWSATCGAVDAQGLYTAPASAGSCTVTATSVADASRSATATVEVVEPVVAAVTISPSAVTLAAGQQQAFSATVTGVEDTTVSWSSTCGSIDGQGRYTAPATAGSCTVTARSNADPTKVATATVQVIVPVKVQVSPTAVTLATEQQQVFSATVTGAADTTVSWSSTCGSIDGQGRYTAPAAAGSCVVTARSNADPTKTATASVQVVVPVRVQVSPTTVSLETGAQQVFTATVTGATDTTVSWSATCGSIDGQGRYTAPATAGSCTVTARSNADPTKAATASVQVAVPVKVTVSPSAVTLAVGQQQAFTATVTGATNTSVSWSTTCGSISASGLYVAPSTTGTCTVTATSNADVTRSASAQVSVTPAPTVEVVVAPTQVTLELGDSRTFTATVSGTSQTGVSWSATGGTISASGVYTATVGPAVFTVKATSVADPSKSATATVRVVPKAFNLSGTVTPTGNHPSRPIHIVVQTPSGSTVGGTRIAGTGGSFTVRGLTEVGTLYVYAFNDVTGLYEDYFHPASELGSVAVTSTGSDVTGVSIQLDPVPVVTPQVPSAPELYAGDGLIYVRPMHNWDAPRYKVYWSGTPNPGPSNHLGSVTLSAIEEFVLQGVANGVTFYVATSAVTASGVEGPLSAVATVQPSAVGTQPRTMSGTITASGVTRNGSLYAVVWDNGVGRVHRIATPPAAAQSYTLPVPQGAPLVSFILDTDNDGILGVTDPGYLQGYQQVDTTSGNATGINRTIATGNSDVSLRTANVTRSGTQTFRLGFRVDSVAKMVARVELLSGPQLGEVHELGSQFSYGSFGTWVNLGPTVPVVGDTYTLKVFYTDGSQETVTTAVTGVFPSAPTMTSVTTTSTPTFTWAPLATPPTWTYDYLLDVYDASESWLWSAQRPSGTTSAVYNSDGQADRATLTPGSYFWNLFAVDAYGNYAGRAGTFSVQ